MADGIDTTDPRPDDLSEWWICVRPLAHDIPAHVRVKRFLKAALRAYSLRCEGIQAKPPEILTSERNER